MFDVAATNDRVERRAARRLATWSRDYLRQVALADLACGVVGVFMAVAMLAQLLAEHRAEGRSWRSFMPEILKRPDVVLGLLLAPFGTFVYMLFLRYWMGDGLAFLHVQRAWARAYGNPVQFVWSALTDFPHDSWVPTAPQQLAVAVITGFVLIGILFWKRQWAGATFSVISLIVPLFAGMASTLRFTAGLAPLVLLATKILARNRLVFALALLGFFVADYYAASNWISGALSLV